LKRALRRSWVEPGHEYEKHFDMNSPVLDGCHRACEVLGDSAGIHYRAGRMAEAVECLTLLLGLGDRSSVKGHLMNAWLRAKCTSTAAERLRDMLGDCDFSGTELEELQRVFDVAESSREPLKLSIQVDDLLMRLLLLEVVDSGKSGSLRDWFSANVMIARALSVQDRYASELQRAVLLREPERTAAFVQDLYKAEGPFHHRWFYDLTAAQADMQGACALHLAQVAIALARFRGAQGRFPESLAELTPAFLNSIPRDDRNGKPFGYLHAAGVASVYSFGHDLDDDGGRPVFGNDPEGDGDVVWIVKRRETAAK